MKCCKRSGPTGSPAVTTSRLCTCSPTFNDSGIATGDFPVTETIAASTIALPFYTNLQPEQIASHQRRTSPRARAAPGGERRVASSRGGARSLARATEATTHRPGSLDDQDGERLRTRSAGDPRRHHDERRMSEHPSDAPLDAIGIDLGRHDRARLRARGSLRHRDRRRRSRAGELRVDRIVRRARRPQMPLIDLLRRRLNRTSPALVFEGSTFTTSDLVQQVAQLAALLKAAGVGRGSKVLVALPNCPAFLLLLLAVNESGAVFIPVNPGLAADERGRIDAIARPDFVITDRGTVELLPGAFLSRTGWTPYGEDVSGLAAIIFTSGTTGMPKGVMMTEEALLANARGVAQCLGLSDADTTLVFLPLYYSYTLSQVLSTLVAGGSVVLLRNLFFPQLVFSAIAEQRVTGFGGVPTSLNILATQRASAAGSVDSLRYILSAGGPLSASVIDRVQAAFPGAALFNNYGCTEIGPRATAVDYTSTPGKIGSIGRPIPGVSVTIVRPDRSVADVDESGEIVLSGPSLMKGYYRDPETTSSRMSRHGFHTGDYAYADARGFSLLSGPPGRHLQVGGREDQRAERSRTSCWQHDSGERGGGHRPARSGPRHGARRLRRAGALERRAPSASCRRSAPAACRGTRFRAPCTSSTSCSKTSIGQSSEVPTPRGADMTIAPPSLVGGGDVPWGCWDPEDHAGAVASAAVHGAGQRHARRPTRCPRRHWRTPCGSRSTRSRCESWQQPPARPSSPSTTSRGRRRLHAVLPLLLSELEQHSRREHQDSRRARRPSPDGARAELERKLGAAIARRVRRRAAPSVRKPGRPRQSRAAARRSG